MCKIACKSHDMRREYKIRSVVFMSTRTIFITTARINSIDVGDSVSRFTGQSHIRVTCTAGRKKPPEIIWFRLCLRGYKWQHEHCQKLSPSHFERDRDDASLCKWVTHCRVDGVLMSPLSFLAAASVRERFNQWDFTLCKITFLLTYLTFYLRDCYLK